MLRTTVGFREGNFLHVWGFCYIVCEYFMSQQEKL